MIRVSGGVVRAAESGGAAASGPGQARRRSSGTRKSAAAFRTISEVSEVLEVPQHVLRFWETKFSPVRPMKRGGGRRYYRPEDVAVLRGIREFLYVDGYTIKGVQKLVREHGVRLLNERADGKTLEPTAEEAPAPAMAAAPSIETGSPNDGARRELEAVLDDLEAMRDLLKNAL